MNILIVCKLLYDFTTYHSCLRQYSYMLYYVHYMNLIIIQKW